MNAIQRRTKEAGEYMRFITPLLLGIALFVLSDIRGTVATMNASVSNLTPRVAILETQVDNLKEKIR